MLSPILRLQTGFINQVNEAIIGDAVSPSPTGLSRFLGQLGKEVELDDDNIRVNTALGTVYGGRFRYVRLSASAGVPVIGQALFWDDSVAGDLYQVTTAENSLTYTSTSFAGVNLTPSLTVGNYTVIQTWGRVYVHYRASIGGTKATGRPVSLANQGAGADLGFFDIVDSDVPQYFVGYAIDLPTDGALKLIDMRQNNMRG